MTGALAVREAGAEYAAARDPAPASSPAFRAASRRARAASKQPAIAIAEEELTAAWLLGRLPAEALPFAVLRPGRAGRGAGPDVREATLRWPDGVVVTGPVEVHLSASDFVRHGHAHDPAYARLVAHLVWADDRSPERRAAPGAPVRVAGGRLVPTVVVGPAFGGQPSRLRAALRRGPSGAEPCAHAGARFGAERAAALVVREGQRRLAERAWRAGALAAERGWAEAWRLLLWRALERSAGRRAEPPAARAALAAAVTLRLGPDPLATLAALASAGGGVPGALISALEDRAGADVAAGAPRLGRQRAAEVGWNAALPLLIALAAAYDDVALARATASLAARWPSPRPYGRTLGLRERVPPAVGAGGALHAQGLLHLQDLWCERGGCGLCPLSAGEA